MAKHPSGKFGETDEENDQYWDQSSGISWAAAMFDDDPGGGNNIFDDNQFGIKPNQAARLSQQVRYNFENDDVSFDDIEDQTSSTQLSISVDPNSIRRSIEQVKASEPQLTFSSKQPTKDHESVEKFKIGHRNAFISPEETVKDIVAGRAFVLETYRSRTEKLLLIDEAIKTHDGNAILATVLHLRRTMGPQFVRHVRQRPEAISSYLSYLERNGKVDDHLEFLRQLSWMEELAMLRYKQALRRRDPGERLAALQSVKKLHLNPFPSLSYENSMVTEHITLLELQRPIEESDVKASSQGTNEMMVQKPRSAAILHMPLVTTLYYCSLYHYDSQPTSFANPYSLRQRFAVGDKQYLWVAISALARMERWPDIERLLTTKNLFGRAKWTSAIGFDKVSAILHSCNAPVGQVSFYLKLVGDDETRFTLAKKFRCNDVLVEYFIAKKDRVKLTALRDNSLKPQTRDWRLADDALRNSSIKWKN